MAVWASQQDTVSKARAALLDSRLTGEATLPSNPGGGIHPATHNGGFYMGEVSHSHWRQTFKSMDG